MHPQVQASVLVNVVPVILFLVSPITRGQSSSTDECLKRCQSEQIFWRQINPGWENPQCARKCNSSARPIPNEFKPPTRAMASLPTTPSVAPTTTRQPTTTRSTSTTTVLTTVPTTIPTTTPTTSTTTTTTPTTTTTTSTTTTTPKTTTTTSTTTTTPTTTTTTLRTTVPTSTAPTSRAPSTTSDTEAPNLICGIQREGIHKHRHRVIGGYPADRCEYPWIVMVAAATNICGGAILDEFHVLTAAHCVKDRSLNRPYSISRVQVLAGSSSITLTKEYNVINIITHSLHDPGSKVYDVAVLTVAKKFEFSECLRPICLPEMNSEPMDADICVVAGWGVTTTAAPYAMMDLQEVELPIVDQADCQKSYGTSRVNELTFCAGDFQNGGRDSCQGDSGGPLMCLVKGRFVVHGIVSSGSGCAVAAFPGIYTKVAHPAITEFIKSATRAR